MNFTRMRQDDVGIMSRERIAGMMPLMWHFGRHDTGTGIRRSFQEHEWLGFALMSLAFISHFFISSQLSLFSSVKHSSSRDSITDVSATKDLRAVVKPKHTRLCPIMTSPSPNQKTPTLLRSPSKPTLDDLKLAHNLSGETCPPVSFPDLAGFVAIREFTTENLLFVIWFLSYRTRYEALDSATRNTVPIPSTRLGDRYNLFEHLASAQIVQGTAEKEQVVF